MTLIATLQQRLWECPWNKMNKPKVVQSLYFNVVALDFWNSAVNQLLRALLARQELCKSSKKMVPEAVKLFVR
jgi:Gpi18-like mannosyltransferase